MQVVIKYSDKNSEPPIKKMASMNSSASNESKAFKEAVECLNQMIPEIYGDGCAFLLKDNQFTQRRVKDSAGKLFLYSRNGIEISVQID